MTQRTDGLMMLANAARFVEYGGHGGMLERDWVKEGHNLVPLDNGYRSGPSTIADDVRMKVSSIRLTRY